MSCDSCGARTTRSTYCVECARDRRRDARPQAPVTVDVDRVWACSECGYVHRAPTWTGCPACDANGRHRNLGQIEEASA